MMNKIPSRLGIALFGLDSLALIGTWVGAALLGRHLSNPLPEAPSDAALDSLPLYGNIYAVMGLVVLALFYSKNLYSHRIPWWTQVRFISKVVLFALAIHLLTSGALHLGEPLFLTISSWGTALIALITLRSVAFHYAQNFCPWIVPTIVIADAVTATDITYAFEADHSTGYRIEHIFLRSPDTMPFDMSELPKGVKAVTVHDNLDHFDRFVKDHSGFFYVLSLDSFRGENRYQLTGMIEDAKAPYALLPPIARSSTYLMDPLYFFGHDIMMLQPRTPLSETHPKKLIKRGLDIVLSGTALLALSPLLFAVVAMLKIEGQSGSPFYGGRRIGRNGAFFNCWKFRSMEPNSDHLLHTYLDANPEAKADWEKYRKLPCDPRVTTQTARFIRKASIDELPQLWNVFVGDMSLVGPRPILEDEISYFGETYKEYISVRPGLTGLWQVSGRNQTSFMRRVYWDSWYVRNWSLWGDIVIMIKTPIVLISRKGAS